MPNTHAPHCQLQPPWKPPMKPDTSNESVIAVPAGITLLAKPGLLNVLPAVAKCWLLPVEDPALAPT